MRKIAVVTGTRAEYGLMYWIIKRVHDDPELELQLIVTGAHLSHEFGMTVDEIETDGFPIADRVEMLLSSDSETAVATSMGLAMIGFAKSYERLKPDILLVLGDRFETFSAVASAIPFRIPVAHIHGGESTEGSMDESFRHAITKMSHLHFPATEEYAKRIIQMGENPERVFCFGAPGLESIFRLKLLSKGQLCQLLNIPIDKNIGIVTYHPSTLEDHTEKKDINEILEALKRFPDIFWLFTYPNADMGGRIIVKKIQGFIEENPTSGRLFSSLGQLKYLSLMKHATLMVGNSSSGIIEAPSFKLPVVNIGDRQKGRVRAKNVIDVEKCKMNQIIVAIKKALSVKFKGVIKDIENPYGDGNTCVKIYNIIKKIVLDEKVLKKHFWSAYD